MRNSYQNYVSYHSFIQFRTCWCSQPHVKLLSGHLSFLGNAARFDIAVQLQRELLCCMSISLGHHLECSEWWGKLVYPSYEIILSLHIITREMNESTCLFNTTCPFSHIKGDIPKNNICLDHWHVKYSHGRVSNTHHSYVLAAFYNREYYAMYS